jgi:hypothetical protein
MQVCVNEAERSLRLERALAHRRIGIKRRVLGCVEGRQIVPLLVDHNAESHTIAWWKTRHSEMDRFLRKEGLNAVRNEFGIAFQSAAITSILSVKKCSGTG